MSLITQINNNTKKEQWGGKAGSTGRHLVKSSLRGYTSFLPWLMKSGRGSGQLTAHLNAAPTSRMLSASFPVLTDMAWPLLIVFQTVLRWAESVKIYIYTDSVISTVIYVSGHSACSAQLWHLICWQSASFCLKLQVKVCMHECICRPFSKTSDNAIIRSYQYSSDRPRRGPVLIEIALGHPRLSTFTQIHTQVL